MGSSGARIAISRSRMIKALPQRASRSLRKRYQMGSHVLTRRDSILPYSFSPEPGSNIRGHVTDLGPRALEPSPRGSLGQPDFRGGLDVGDPPAAIDVDQGVVVVPEEPVGRPPAKADPFLRVRNEAVDPLLLGRDVHLLSACFTTLRR